MEASTTTTTTTTQDENTCLLRELAEEDLVDRLSSLVESSSEACDAISLMADGYNSDIAVPQDISVMTKVNHDEEEEGVESNWWWWWWWWYWGRRQV